MDTAILRTDSIPMVNPTKDLPYQATMIPAGAMSRGHHHRDMGLPCRTMGLHVPTVQTSQGLQMTQG